MFSSKRLASQPLLRKKEDKQFSNTECKAAYILGKDKRTIPVNKTKIFQISEIAYQEDWTCYKAMPQSPYHLLPRHYHTQPTHSVIEIVLHQIKQYAFYLFIYRV